MPFCQKDYFELKAAEKKQVQENITASSYLPINKT